MKFELDFSGYRSPWGPIHAHECPKSPHRADYHKHSCNCGALPSHNDRYVKAFDLWWEGTRFEGARA